MFTLFLAILSALSGGAIILQTGQFLVRRVRTRRPLYILYPFGKSRKVWIVLPGIAISKDGEFFDRASPIDGVSSFADLSSYLRLIGLSRAQYEPLFSAELGAAMYGDDLILIGGYETNEVSKSLNDSQRDCRCFYLEDNQIFERAGGKRSWGISLDGDHRIVKDHCLITKMRNPFRSDYGPASWIVAFEGVRQFGTFGAVRYWNERLNRHLKPVSGRDHIEAVLAIKVNHVAGNYHVENAGLEALYVNGTQRK